MKDQEENVQCGPTWGLRLIGSLPMRGFAYDLLTELELTALKSHSSKAASAYEIVLANYCVQKSRADVSDNEIERLTAENKRRQHLEITNVEMITEVRRLKEKCNSLLKTISNSTPDHYPSREDLRLEVIS